MTLINKDAKINKFINDVIVPAINAIQFHKDNVDTGVIETAIERVSALSVRPTSFHQINPLGGLITASDLAALFQIYAWQLTSIRVAQIRRMNTNDGAISYTAIGTGITALSRTFCMPISTFNSYVRAAPDPFTNLQPSNVASEAALDALIARLASICTNQRSNSVGLLEICHSSCHSSCHGSCHGSRGRR